MPKHFEKCICLCRLRFSGKVKALCNRLLSVHFMSSFSFNSRSPFIASTTLLKTQMIWTPGFLDIFFSMLDFKLLEITFSNFSLTWWELETLLSFLAWKQKFSFDHLSVDTRHIRQRAIIERLMTRLQMLAALCIQFRALQGDADKFACLSFNLPLKMLIHCHLLKKKIKNLSNGTF